jgi:hypothetical protein
MSSEEPAFVGVLSDSSSSAIGGFYGRAIARMLTDMANGFGLG